LPEPTAWEEGLLSARRRRQWSDRIGQAVEWEGPELRGGGVNSRRGNGPRAILRIMEERTEH